MKGKHLGIKFLHKTQDIQLNFSLDKQQITFSILIFPPGHTYTRTLSVLYLKHKQAVFSFAKPGDPVQRVQLTHCS